jgi:thiol-disulfide isomerase/thioredoxin
MGNTTMVCDGEHTWIYFPALKQYVKKDAIRGPQALLDSFGMGNMTDPSKFQKEAKTIREEALEVDGKKVDCWVIELRIDHLEMPTPGGTQLTDGVITLWIEKTTDFNRQMTMSGKMQGGPMPQPVEMKQRMLIRSLKFDEPLPDSLFQFTPPEGAKEVAEFSYGGGKKSSLAGKPAPAFQVKSLDGAAYDLSALKGKVVLLDFWATWCGPCRKEIPGIERLHREFKDQGLVVIGMNVGEERETVEGFLKMAAVSYPVVLTADTNVVAAYEVNAFPTYVVIGRDGIVTAYQVGGAGEQALRDLLGKAELKPKTPKP